MDITSTKMVMMNLEADMMPKDITIQAKETNMSSKILKMTMTKKKMNLSSNMKEAITTMMTMMMRFNRSIIENFWSIRKRH